jgi:hypothetical protein
MGALGIECQLIAGKREGGETEIDFVRRHFGVK